MLVQFAVKHIANPTSPLEDIMETPSNGSTLLAAVLHASCKDNVVLASPERSTSDFMLVTVPGELVAQFLARLHNPLGVEYTDGDDTGHTWQSTRTETITEAALSLLGIEVGQLAYDLRSKGANASETSGDLYVDGEEIVIVLVDADRLIIPALTAITRMSVEGQTYPLFEQHELALKPVDLRVYLPESSTWL